MKPDQQQTNLRWHDGHFRALVEQAPDIISRFDRHLRHLYVNPAVVGATGIPREAFIGRTNEELGMPEEITREWNGAMRDVFQDGLEREITFRFPAPDGERLYHTCIVPEFDANEEVGSIFCIARDVTSAAVTVEEEWSSVEAFADLLPHVVWWADVRGNVLHYNRKWEEYTGVHHSAGRDGKWPDVIHPDHAQLTLDTWQRSVESGEDYRIVHLLRRWDGQYRWFMSLALPQRDGQGRIRRWVGSATDVHEQRRHADALRRSEERFRAAVETAGLVVFNQDSDLRYTWVSNPRDGYDTSELIGKSDEDLFDDEATLDRLTRLKKDVLKTGERSRKIVSMRNRAGDVIYDLSVSPSRNEHGEITGLTCAALDVTEQARRQAALDQAIHARDDVLKLIAHDLRNPIQRILLASQYLLTFMDGESKEYVESIETASQTLRRLVDDLLDVSRIESGVFTVEPEPVDFGLLVREVVGSCESIAADREVSLTILQEDGEALIVTGDDHHLRRLVTNLLDNAMKFSPAGANVEVVTAARDGIARLEVRDSGPGVPADYLPYIFQAHRQHSHAKGGAGLGLFISKGIAEAHHGSIWCESEEGEGASFIAEIPLRAEE